MGQQHRSYREAKIAVLQGSRCRSLLSGPPNNPELLSIEFDGPVAHIPALKNQKISGTNILRAEAKAKLVAMSELFQKSLNYEVPQFSPKARLYCMILLAYRPNAYDEDNCLTTIKDWLEPRFIRNRDREWGIGVVPNDRQVNAFAVKKEKADSTCGITEIIIMPERNLRDALFSFVSVFTDARKRILYESQKNEVAVGL